MTKSHSEHTVSTAGRLKYADPRDLPSFPSSGLSSGGAAASAAASLGWANQKSPEPWRPDKNSSASAAAVLAKNYKTSTTWEPGSASEGASKAALLAVGSAGAALNKSPSSSPQKEKRNTTNTWGNSAATQAFNAIRPSSAEPTSLTAGTSAATQAFQTSRTHTRTPDPVPAPYGDRSLAAAKGAMSISKKDHSSPSATQSLENQRLEARAASSALNGAALAHRNSMLAKTSTENAGAVSVTTMTRNMFTSNPPVKLEVDEKANNERLHNTAVEMAKKMYLHQQKMLDQAKEHATETPETPYAGTYLNLQDAAYKQAQERLAKLHNAHQQNRDIQEYYGNTKTSPRRKFSVANKLRRYSSGDLELDDQERSKKIREEMSLFSNKLSQVDKEKRDKDREALLAAAQRNVKAKLQGMDEKVYRETGKRNSTMLTDWELKAQQAAQLRHETRSENKGKVDIGGGKFMDQAEINAIAAKKMQPVLDDINEKAEAERQRLATLKMEADSRREELERQKAREKEEKRLEKAEKQRVKEDEHARKEEERSKKAAEKHEEKIRNEELKSNKAEEQRLAKGEKRHSKLVGKLFSSHSEETPADTATTTINKKESSVEDNVRGESQNTALNPTSERAQHLSSNESDLKPKSTVKGWLKNRFSRTKSVHERDLDETQRSVVANTTQKESADDDESPTVDASVSRAAAVSNTTEDEGEPLEIYSSVKETMSDDEDETQFDQDSRGVSPVSARDIEEDQQTKGEIDKETTVLPHDETIEDRTHRSLEPPKPLNEVAGRESPSPTRDSRFREEINQ